MEIGEACSVFHLKEKDKKKNHTKTNETFRATFSMQHSQIPLVGMEEGRGQGEKEEGGGQVRG